MKQTTTNSLALLSLALTAASCQAAISPCISGGGWSFHINTNYNVDDNNGNDVQCTYAVAKDAFEEEVFSQSLLLKDGCSNTVEEEFFAHLGVETLEDAEAAIYEVCGSAQEKIRKYPLSDVTYEKGSQFIELFYAGRSTWNEETETLLYPSDGTTPAQNLKQDSAFVKIYYDASKLSAFEMPDLPQFEPDQCTSHAAMCCWPRDRQANDNNGNCNKEYDENCIDKDVADNTDLCYVELGHAPYSSGVDANGFSLFPNDNNNGEGAIHCHGFAWALDDQEVLSRYKANNLFYVSMYDHMYTRGYVENIPGSPMCGCVEDMPVVSRSDCTQTNVKEYYVFTKKAGEPGFVGIVDRIRLEYQACQGANNKNNDLSAFVQQLVNDEKITTAEQDIFNKRVVGNNQCNNAITNALESDNFTKGFNIDSDKWTFIAGEGFPEEDLIQDARLFKEMFESQDQAKRIVRRVCPSCDETHKDIYYRRLTTMPDDFDLLDTLMNNWFDTDNTLDVDFALYSSYMDAYYDQNRWTFCNYNDPGIGFPRDCGPKGRVNSNWNSYYRGGGRANHHAFLLPSNPSFNSQIINIADEKHATVKQSTVSHGGVAERAVDGNTVGIWNWGSTTHTRSESNPWWQVTFDYNTAVDKVYFWNRIDAGRDRLNNARVSLYQDGKEVNFINVAGAAKVMNVVDFGGIFGDTVRISLPSGGILSLAEVQVQGLVHTPAPTISAAPTSSPAPTMTHPGVSGYGLGVQDARNYWLAYGIDIPNTVNFGSSAGAPYTEDYSGENDMPLPATGFNRVGYYLELEKDGEVQWVWVSFDAFTADIKKIAFPTFASGAIFQEEVTNMNVASSISALNKEGITGNIEFWPYNYGTKNTKGVSGASNSVFDLGDERSSGGSYGSMQVHSSELGGTIFAINRWNTNTAVDIGIGNNPNGNPDWTFKENGNSYTTKRLEVLVKRAPTPAPTISAAPTSSPAPTTTHPGVSGYGLGVQDARNYWLAYGINIPNTVNFGSSAGAPYTEDYSGENALPATGFNRVGYYLELEKDGEVQWVWVSFDAFTADIKKIAFPTFASGAIFQEEVTNMNVASSISALNKEGITGNIEFWPYNYGTKNTKGVSGASNSVYDLGDERSSGGSYGSMQVHSSELGGTIFAINRWNINTAVDIGIGNNPNGNPDWTFKVNGNSYTTKRLEVLVLSTM